MRIGIHKSNYSVDKAICGEQPPNQEFTTVPSIDLGIFPGSPDFLHWVRFFKPLAKVDIFHTFNYLVLNRRPWIVSFESYLPRFIGSSLSNRKAWFWGLNLLASSRCLRILPISHAARNLFLKQASSLGYPYDYFEHKLQVIYPGVPFNASAPREIGRRAGPLRILFVGNAFFRKGGRPLIEAFMRLSRNYRIELIIVSRLQIGDYITHSDINDYQWIINQIKNTPSIIWRKNIANIELLRDYFPSADIFVLPTMGDSFGYVIIEAMACGLPVISTNQFAIPELVQHDRSGFLIELPLDENLKVMKPPYRNHSKRKKYVRELEAILYDNLVRYLSILIESPDLRAKFGKYGYDLFKEKFSIEVRNRALNRMYADVEEKLRRLRL